MDEDILLVGYKNICKVAEVGSKNCVAEELYGFSVNEGEKWLSS
jgi:hypothetical protein